MTAPAIVTPDLVRKLLTALEDVHQAIDTPRLCPDSRDLDWIALEPQIYGNTVWFGVTAYHAGERVGTISATASVGSPAEARVVIHERSPSFTYAFRYVELIDEFVRTGEEWFYAARIGVKNLAGRIGHLSDNPETLAHRFAGETCDPVRVRGVTIPHSITALKDTTR